MITRSDPPRLDMFGEVDAAWNMRVMEKYLPPAVSNLGEVARERLQQDERWGEQNHPDGTGRKDDHILAAMRKTECDHAARSHKVTWRHILAEEVAEAFAETDPALLRAELVQVAAVAVAWTEALDRRSAE